jgi:RNA-directed DNA polymerase
MLSTPSALANIIPMSGYSGSPLPNGTALSLLGYPGHHAARPIRIEAGQLIRSFPRSTVSYLEITPKIMGGNSGGPVINDKHEVVGVAVMGLNGKVELKTSEFLAVNIAELAKL